jgi:3-phosphoshikimate 1-carboxyvinyltransferase
VTEAVGVQPLQFALDGAVDLPGDKSISHRAFLLNSLGEGSASIRGFNPGADVQRTIQCLRSLGVSIVAEGESLRVEGRGGRLRCPSSSLDCGNSGTTLRLLAGILAAQEFSATLDGDESLRSRPMARISQPLRQMGARVEGPSNGERPPLIISGSELVDSSFDLRIASAQLKSCLLLAAAAAGTPLRLREPYLSRDHTERMLAAMGGDLIAEDGWIQWTPGPSLSCVDVDVPGDPSALALLAAALCARPGSRMAADAVLLGPTRAAFLDVLVRAGFEVHREARREMSGELIGDVRMKSPDELRAFEIDADAMPSLLDEIPALAVVAAQAHGRSIFHGIAELRVKESDRVAGVESLLRQFGVESGADEETLWIEGGFESAPDSVEAGEDHRMVMAAVALSLSAATREGRAVAVSDLKPASVSFPGFRGALRELGADLA